MVNTTIHCFLDGLSQVKKAVEGRLKEFLEEKASEAARLSPSSEEMIRVLDEFTLRGGKRLRAALIVYGYHCFSGQEDEAVWDAAMSIELIQSFLLIHDDVIDGDATRRGGSTVHRWYQDLYRERYTGRGSEHFGESMAILCGDLAFILANEIMAGAQLPGEVKTAVLAAMNGMVRRVIHGECLDVLSGVEEDLGEDEILTIYQLKSAAYTVEGPLHMGAILGGGTARDLELASRYAIPLGEAFQIQDDILGLYGKEEKLGKPVGSDIREGKKTFLILKAMEKGTRTQQEYLLSCLGNPDFGEEELEKVRQIVMETGALAYAQEMAGGLLREAGEALRDCQWRPEGKDFLEGAVSFILDRDH